MMERFLSIYLNTYLQYYLLSQDVVDDANPEYTHANEVMDGREKHYLML